MEKKFEFNFIAFFVAFAIGMLYVYMTTPKPNIVIKYPSPFNAGKIVYRDDSDTCFIFNANKVECPSDKKKIKPQPIIQK